MRRTCLALAVLLTAVCVPTAEVRAQDSTVVEKPSSDYITREQVVAGKFANLYELVEALHNNWLRERIPSPGDRAAGRADTTKATYVNDYNATGKSFAGSNGGIQVYIDGTRAGSIEQLKSLRPNDVWSIRHINGIDAQARFGIGHGAGVIYVVSLTAKGRAQ